MSNAPKTRTSKSSDIPNQRLGTLRAGRYPQVSPTLNIMIDAAERAGRRLIRDFGEVENLQVSRKSPGDFVSKADLKSEATIKEVLSEARPNYGFLAEESGASQGSEEARWIIDPLDGTTNFLHGIPHWSISIALEKAGELVAGVVFDPIKDEMFYAEKDKGAYLNNRKIRVSARETMEESLFATGFPFLNVGEIKKFSQRLEKTTSESSGTRRFGSAALDCAYVAAGRYEAYWEEPINLWDVAAGIVIVREAKGKISDIYGDLHTPQSRSIIASNTLMHEEIVKRMKI